MSAGVAVTHLQIRPHWGLVLRHRATAFRAVPGSYTWEHSSYISVCPGPASKLRVRLCVEEARGFVQIRPQYL